LQTLEGCSGVPGGPNGAAARLGLSGQALGARPDLDEWGVAEGIEQSDPRLAANASPCRKGAKPENGYWFYNASKQMFKSAAVR
jgi:hypothetical protein